MAKAKSTRKCESWIDAFVKSTENLDAPVMFRRWAAIATIASVVEQRIFLMTSSPLFPNVYVVLIGHPGTGKTRTIRVARKYFMEVPEFHLAPTSLTGASLIDNMVESKRMIIRPPDAPLEYNAVAIMADEFGTFMSQYDHEMVAILSSFYDQDPYGQKRRGKDINIKIKSPQVNILCGSTPSNLLKLMPEGAWDQGFTSRIMFIFSDERFVGDDFAARGNNDLNKDMVHDLRMIANLEGRFSVSDDFRQCVNNWRQLGEPPVPEHPKLTHYNTRRRVHLYKLAMISALDKSNTLILSRDDFNRAMGWMLEAEANMPDIFKEGASSTDAQAMDDVLHFIRVECLKSKTKSILEHRIINYARNKVPAHAVIKIIEVMERSGLIYAVGLDPLTKMRMWSIRGIDLDVLTPPKKNVIVEDKSTPVLKVVDPSLK